MTEQKELINILKNAINDKKNDVKDYNNRLDQKLSEKCNLSIYTSFMHEKPSYTCCISENTKMAYIKSLFGDAFEPLVQMDFKPNEY